MMTEDQLAAIEARAHAATPGPWYAFDGVKGLGVQTDRIDYSVGCDGIEPLGIGQLYEGDYSLDLQFVAHARADIPALVAEVRRLQRENAVYEAAVALAETCELGCGDYGGNIFDDELLFKYREALLNGESEGA